MSHSRSRSFLDIKRTILLTRSFHNVSIILKVRSGSLAILQRIVRPWSWFSKNDRTLRHKSFALSPLGVLFPWKKYSSTTRPNPHSRISKSRICQIWILHDTIFIQLSNFMSVQPTVILITWLLNKFETASREISFSNLIQIRSLIKTSKIHFRTRVKNIEVDQKWNRGVLRLVF